jgi:AbiU2
MVIGPPLPVGWVPPKPSPRVSHLETVRRIVTLARGDGMEISALAMLLQNSNEGGVNKILSNAGAGQAALVVRNSLFARLILLVTREFAKKSREGDLHLGRAFELLEGDTLAILQDVGSSKETTAAIDKSKKLRGDQRLNSLNHFRDKNTAHLGVSDPNIPPAINNDLFDLSEEVIDLIDHLAEGIGLTKVKIREDIDAKTTVEAFWRPWKRDSNEANQSD